ncbi:S9 family peptidase [Gilliamella sp. B2824]|uniref:prolyl oligopeptidase family serine peptidase n=1 Tax=Gilliamella sp. B2824 TaxID=2818019 RepID=UPI00226AA9C3|nr:prolyl oligopeptidase family serine peptidase [Gilliamella sp. B2824]MCX8739115.1 S9 family peptidase [Gilliamella sp. B2824]
MTIFKDKTAIIILILLLSSICSCCKTNNELTLKQIDTNDKYRWMENQPQLINNWLLSESERTVKTLNALPWQKTVSQRFDELTDFGAEPRISDIQYVGDNCFYFKQTADHPYNRLFVKDRFNNEKVLIDPPIGYGIYDFYPSHDGQYIAYSIYENGAEISSIKIINVKTKSHLNDDITGISDPSIIWSKDNLSFFYKRNDRYQHNSQKSGTEEVYRHYLNANRQNDVLIFGTGQISDYNPFTDQNTSLSFSSNWAIASVSPSISGYSIDLYITPYDDLQKNNAHWQKIIDRKQNVTNFILKDDWLYLAKYNDLSGYTISRVNLNKNGQPEEKIMAWQNGELTQFAASKDAIYLAYHESTIPYFVTIPFADTHHVKLIPLANNEEVTAIFSNADRKEILFTAQNWTVPPKIFSYDPDNGLIQDTKMINPSAFSFANYEAEQQWIKSSDGTLIPMTIIHPKGIKYDGTAPTWLTTYGAYGVSQLAFFDATRLIWLERGGIIAIAHVRGGGELGKNWHIGGSLANKQNSVDDFIKCAQYLINHHITQPSKLVISGESAGGIIIGMALAKHPELFAAASINVGMLNMSRLDNIAIGNANFAEFGSPLNAKQLNDLSKIDAYLNLKDNVTYPPVMISLGLKDERVAPWQSAKFIARLNAINHSKKQQVFVIADQYEGHFLDNFLNTVEFFIWQTMPTP